MKVVRLSASRTDRLYPPGNVPGTHFHWGLSRLQGHGTVGRNMSLKNPVTLPGIDPRTVRLVAQRLNHYATPGPYFKLYNLKNYHNLIGPQNIIWQV